MIDLERLLVRLPAEAADAVVGMARLQSAALAADLRASLGAPSGVRGSIVAEPFLEGAFPWRLQDGGWDGLAPDVRMDVFRYVGIVHSIEDLFPMRVDVSNRIALKPHVKPTAEREAIYAF